MQIVKAGNLFTSGGMEAPKPTVRRKYRYLKGFTVMRIIALALCFGILGVRGEGQNVFNVPTPTVENPLAKEGLALSRIVFSPVNILGHSYAQIEHYGGVGIVLSPILIVGSVPGGALAACCDIVTGVGEMLTCQQFKVVDYPWQSGDYATSERWCDLALVVLDGVGKVADQTQKTATEIDSLQHGGRGSAQAGAEAPSNGDAVAPASGYGSISGPTTLRTGSTATYKLYVGGRIVNADWHQGGTSISVYGSGDHARAMAGNPPIKRGRYRTGIRASYNGKSYSKTIYIQK